ncbi:cellulase family glycosylhydrolase [Psychromonas sp.]|nr:cellulase family glycosylhydrolase [Psychromonas sp.]
MKNIKKFSQISTMCLMAGLGMVYSGVASAVTDNLSCSIDNTDVWSSGFVLNNVKITNNSGATIDDWEVQIKLGATNASITNYWSSVITQDSDIATISNESYNGKLADGESATFGFQGTYSGTWDEASCIVNSTTPVIEEPAIEEPVIEEPVVEEPVVEEPETSESLSCIEGHIDVWSGGFVVTDYGIQNVGEETVADWSLLLDFGTEITITNYWNGEPSANANLASLSGSNLTAGNQKTFGFQGTYSGELINNPPHCTVTGNKDSTEPETGTGITYEVVQGDDWLHTNGSTIVDSNGNEVWLTGTNWFGFNTGSDMFDGLWAANIETAIKEMTERGINILRVPISTELMADWMNGVYPVPSSMNASVNPELEGLNSLEVFDYTLKLSQKYGLKILVDAHSASSNAAGHFEELWYDENVSTETFYAAWEWFAERYKNDDTILAFDLENEPHGQAYANPDSAIWDDSDDVNNWKAVSEELSKRILAIHPNILILIEGVETTPIEGKTYASTNKDDYYSNWWGGNLRGVKNYPIDLGTQQDQLVYSPHDYGPSVFLQAWFYDGFDMDSLYKDVWYDNWAYIHEDNIAPLLIGEWGGFMDGGDNETWMIALRDFMIEKRIHHTFWCFNANSGDTGGLVENDFVTWDEEKYQLLEKALWQTEDGLYISLDHAVPLGSTAGTGISVSDVYK